MFQANSVSKRIHSKPQRPARRANQYKRLLITLYFVKFLSPAPKNIVSSCRARWPNDGQFASYICRLARVF
jgi:hypothetical protein